MSVTYSKKYMKNPTRIHVGCIHVGCRDTIELYLEETVSVFIHTKQIIEGQLFVRLNLSMDTV